MNASTLLVGLFLLGAPQDPVVIKVVRPSLQQGTVVEGGITGAVESAPPVLSTEMIVQDGTTIVEGGEMILPDMNYGGCDTCCGTCDDCCRPSLMLFDLRHPPRNMVPHLPYDAQPKTYYYFRPYNWMHIHQHQGDAAMWEASPGNPYSNKVFKDLYELIESEELEELRGEELTPPPVGAEQSDDDVQF